jgi:hypothetical protein
VGVLDTTLFSNTPTTATVAGTHGTLTLPGPFYQPTLRVMDEIRRQIGAAFPQET